MGDKNFKDFLGHDNLKSCFASTVGQPPHSCRVSSCLIYNDVFMSFGVEILIKTKFKNKLGSKNLEAMMQIALEELDEGVDDIIIVPF
jgi:hypothetical protein